MGREVAPHPENPENLPPPASGLLSVGEEEQVSDERRVRLRFFPLPCPALGPIILTFHSPSGPHVKQLLLRAGAQRAWCVSWSCPPCFHRITVSLWLEEHPASSLASLTQVGLSSFSSKRLANRPRRQVPQGSRSCISSEVSAVSLASRVPGAGPAENVPFLKIFGGRKFCCCSHW